MKIAIMSDVHDNIWNLKKALLKVQHCDFLLFCGDLCSPFVLNLFKQHFKNPVHIVFGNNDGDTFRITENAKDSNIKLHGEFYQDTLDGKKVAMNHYPDIAQNIARSGAFELVCYGHDHVAKEYREEQTIVLNPGALMGYNPKPPGENTAPKDIKPTFVIYDAQTDSTTWYVLNNPRNTDDDFVVVTEDINTIDLTSRLGL
jgi:uncharacterized protein